MPSVHCSGRLTANIFAHTADSAQLHCTALTLQLWPSGSLTRARANAAAGAARQSEAEVDQERGSGPSAGGAGPPGEAAADDVIISRDYASRVLQG